MFFTKAGFVIAWFFFVTSAAAYAPILIATLTGHLPELTDATGPMYIRSHGTFVQGILLGVAFGIAAEVSQSLFGRAT